MPKSTRPTVNLTVGRIEGNALNPLQRVYLERVMTQHDQPNRDTLAYACLICGSIGECESQEARDHNERFVDYECCDDRYLVIFKTEAV